VFDPEEGYAMSVTVNKLVSKVSDVFLLTVGQVAFNMASLVEAFVVNLRD